MTDTDKRNNSVKKRWMIIIGMFLIIQLIFISIDGTFLEPRINDSDKLFAIMGRWILDSKIFTEWITAYSFPFFNMFLTIHIIAILMSAVKDISSGIILKK